MNRCRRYPEEPLFRIYTKLENVKLVPGVLRFGLRDTPGKRAAREFLRSLYFVGEFLASRVFRGLSASSFRFL